MDLQYISLLREALARVGLGWIGLDGRAWMGLLRELYGHLACSVLASWAAWHWSGGADSCRPKPEPTKSDMPNGNIIKQISFLVAQNREKRLWRHRGTLIGYMLKQVR